MEAKHFEEIPGGSKFMYADVSRGSNVYIKLEKSIDDFNCVNIETGKAYLVSDEAKVNVLRVVQTFSKK